MTDPERLIFSASRAAALLLIALAATACGSREGRRVELNGVVTERPTSPGRASVAHDAVDGLMPAMIMTFEVRGTAPAVREGDRIAATLVVTADRSWLEDLRITGRDATARTAGV